MLDDLLGRAALKDRIADLEATVEELREDREAAPDRPVTALHGDAVDTVLDRLASFETGPEGALTAMVREAETVADAFENPAGLRRAAPCLALRDDHGLVRLALRPPDPPEPFVSWGTGFELDRGWFQPEGEFALALVRSNLFAMGEYRGRERLDRTAFTADVGENHSKGGFSQGRFERRRTEAIEDHLDECRAAIADREPGRLYVVGEERLLDGFDATATAAVDASGDPEAALDRAFRSFWTTRLYPL